MKNPYSRIQLVKEFNKRFWIYELIVFLFIGVLFTLASIFFQIQLNIFTILILIVFDIIFTSLCILVSNGIYIFNKRHPYLFIRLYKHPRIVEFVILIILSSFFIWILFFSIEISKDDAKEIILLSWNILGICFAIVLVTYFVNEKFLKEIKEKNIDYITLVYNSIVTLGYLSYKFIFMSIVILSFFSAAIFLNMTFFEIAISFIAQLSFFITIATIIVSFIDLYRLVDFKKMKFLNDKDSTSSSSNMLDKLSKKHKELMNSYKKIEGLSTRYEHAIKIYKRKINKSKSEVDKISVIFKKIKDQITEKDKKSIQKFKKSSLDEKIKTLESECKYLLELRDKLIIELKKITDEYLDLKSKFYGWSE